MAKTFRCQIVTPTAEMFDGDVTYVDLPAWDGQMGVMSSRAAMLVSLGSGRLRLEMGAGGRREFVLRDGFAQMDQDTLTLLTEVAEPAESIDAADAERELAAANADLAGSQDGRPRGPEAIEEIAKRQRLAMIRRSVARGRNSR